MIKPIADDWEWQFKGLCRASDPEVFYLDIGMRMGTKEKHEQAAKKICRACPVIAECLNHALAFPEDYGVWGGLSADERLVMSKSA